MIESLNSGQNAARPIQLPCCNVSTEEAPPYAMLEMTKKGASSTALFDNSPAVNKSLFVYATKPTKNNGKCAINSGKLLGAAGQTTSFGDCFFPATSFVWARYEDTVDPGTAWTTEMGPEKGKWTISKKSKGFFYTGIWDKENKRVLVTGTGVSAQVSKSTIHGIIRGGMNPGRRLNPTSFRVSEIVPATRANQPPSSGTWAESTDSEITAWNHNAYLSAGVGAYVICAAIVFEDLTHYVPIWVEELCTF